MAWKGCFGYAAQVLVAPMCGDTAHKSPSGFQVYVVFQAGVIFLPCFKLLGTLLKYGREFGVVWVFLVVGRVQALLAGASLPGLS